MIKPEQIPDKVVIAAREAWLRSDVNAQSDWQVAIAAALNAWPWGIILPVEENSSNADG